MRSALCKALLLAAALTLSTPALAAAADDAAPGGHPTAVQKAQDGEPARREADVDEAAASQTFSTLGALFLGVLGLLWVRRHTAEL